MREIEYMVLRDRAPHTLTTELPQGANDRPHLIASKEIEISVLQLQETGFCH